MVTNHFLQALKLPRTLYTVRGLHQIERDELLDDAEDDEGDEGEDRRRSWSSWTSFREMVMTSLFGQRNTYESVPIK